MVALDAIRIGERYRRDLGDVTALATSIKEHGLLHPVVLTPDYELIAGHRRIEAFRQIGRTEIPVTIIDLENPLTAELDENAVRKDFTPSEMVAIGAAIEDREREKAKARQAEAGHLVGSGQQASGNLPEASKGDTRDLTAAKLGVSGSTYAHAKIVVKAAVADPERFGPIQEEMDRTGKVKPAYDKVRATRAENPAPAKPISRTPSAKAEREEEIRRLHAEGYTTGDIARAVRMSPAVMQKKLNDLGLRPVDAMVGLRRVNVNQVMENIVSAALPPTDALDALNHEWARLDRARFAEWASGIHIARRVLGDLQRRMERESQ